MHVLIGVDPHHHSHTAAVLDQRGELLASSDSQPAPRATGPCAASPSAGRGGAGHRGRRRVGRVLAQQLVANGDQVIDVPAKLAARVREQYQDARILRRRILRLRLPAAAIRAAGPQTCPDGRHGKTTWAQWLGQEPAHPPMS